MTHPGSPLDTRLDMRRDVLDSGTPGRSHWWIASAVVAVVALIAWNLLGSDSDEAVDRVAETQSADRPDDWVSGSPPDSSARPDHVDQLTFVDEQHGFLVRYACSHARGGAACPRRILATTDGGSSWESRGLIPSYAETFHALAAESELELTLVDERTLASMVRSVDGGRSWRRLSITPAEPAAAPAGAALVKDASHTCIAGACSMQLMWIDPARQASHPLPSQPWAGENTAVEPPQMSPDGNIVATSIAESAGLVSVSTDGGLTWVDARLEVPLGSDQTIQRTHAMAAGNGRAYAFVQVYDGGGIDSTYGFRTDDSGATWADLRFEDQPVWIPAGVLYGMLISTDLPGRIFLSSAGGTHWAEAGTVAGGPWLSQTAPDGPVLATVFNHLGEESYHMSTDGRTWTPVLLPGV